MEIHDLESFGVLLTFPNNYSQGVTNLLIMGEVFFVEMFKRIEY